MRQERGVFHVHPEDVVDQRPKALLVGRKAELHRIHDHAHSEGSETDEWVASDDLRLGPLKRSGN